MLLEIKYIILFIVLFHNTSSQHIFFTKFLDQFRNFHVVFHADTSTLNFVDEMIKHVSICSIYNYETFSGVYARPNVSKILNIMMTESADTFNKITSHEVVKHTDVVAFVLWEKSNLTRLKNTRNILRYAGNTFVVHLTEQQIFRGCFYCGASSGKYRLVYATNTTEFNVGLRPLDDFKNFNSHQMNVIYMQYYPFVYCRVSGDPKCPNLHLGGIESKFIDILAEKLNFTYTITGYNSTSTFFHMIEEVHAFNYDFAFGGVSITKDRMPLIQYTMQYNSEDYVFLYLAKLRFREIFHKFGAPFRSRLVWALYIICYVLFCVILHVYNIVHRTFTNTSFTNVFWMLFHQPLEQSYHKTCYFSSRTKYSAMISLMLWWSITLIMVTVYKSSVLSSLVHPPNTEPDNFEDLVNAGFCIAGNVHYEDIIHEMLNVNDPLYRKGLMSASYATGPCATLQKIADGNCAMLDELSEIMFELRAICPQISQMDYEELRVTRKALRSTGHAWALQKGAPYIEAFDYYISLILSGGLIQKWNSDETNKSRRKLFHRSRQIPEQETKALSFQRFTPILLVFLVGDFVATICFICEMIMYYFK